MNHSAQTKGLVDRFGRQVTYVRLSITDRCDFRCTYCMAEDMQFLPRARVLTLEEIAEVGRAFVELGVTKLRLTGGEPLVRRDALQLIQSLGQLYSSGLKELVMTSNGSQLRRYAPALYQAGVKRLNISLDSLQPERFRRITRTGDLAMVLDGIRAAQQAGFQRIKLNAVVMRHRNHDEVCDLVRFALQEGLDISFIEEMPLGEIAEHDRALAFYSSEQIRHDLAHEFELLPSTDNSGGPAKYYRIPGTTSRVGFISPHSHNFCGDCNRVRVTAEGRLLLCLGQEHSVDLRHELRAHPGDRAHLREVLIRAMGLKPKGHEFDLQAKPVVFRHMNMTGG